MRTLSILLFVIFASTAQAQTSLIGQWKSDAPLTMQFNKDRARLTDKKLLFLSQMMGRLTITFTPNTVTLEMPDWESRTESGEKHRLVGFKEVHSYRHIGQTLNTVAVISVEPVSGIETINVFNFDNTDTMWVYTGGTDKAFPREHVREYFVRVR
jgi:hypothetical protein